MFSAPEELILRKMEFYSFGWTEKHLRDIVGMLDRPGADIDEPQIALLAKGYGLGHVWEAVQ